VTPGSSYTDGPIPLIVDAPGTRPVLEIDVRNGRLLVDADALTVSLIPEAGSQLAAVRLAPVYWDGGQRLYVTTPAGLPAAAYTVEVLDGRGGRATLAGAFRSLGPDPDPPRIDVSAPAAGGYLGAGRAVYASVMVDDGDGGLAEVSWRTTGGDAGRCVLGGDKLPEVAPARTTCMFSFAAPPLEDDAPLTTPFSLEVMARDLAGHVTTLETPLVLAKQPVVLSFREEVGRIGGNQAFSVEGKNFIPGSQAFIGGMAIGGGESTVGGELVNESLIVGFTPKHDREDALPVEVRSPAGVAFAEKLFRYVPPPNPRGLQPPVGPVEGGIRVTVVGNHLRSGAEIWIGQTRENRERLYFVRYETESKAVGCLPAGAPGPVTLWVNDLITGEGELRGPFTYLAPTPVPGDEGIPQRQSPDPSCVR
jgi:hypothetical protein